MIKTAGASRKLMEKVPLEVDDDVVEDEEMQEDSGDGIDEEGDEVDEEDKVGEDSAEGTEDEQDDDDGEEDAMDGNFSDESEDKGIMDQNVGNSHGEEMDELEKEYQSIREEQQSILKKLKKRKDEDFLKGLAIKNQKALWRKCLELRLKLQKVFSNSNKLPREPTRSLFCDHDESLTKAYSSLISSSKHALKSILELQKVLIKKNPAIDGKNEDLANDNDRDDKEWRNIDQIQRRMALFRNSAVDKWHRKTQVATGAAAFKGKLLAFNQNMSEQVATYMRDPSRMIKRMQLRRSTAGVLGDVPGMPVATPEEVREDGTWPKEEEAEGDPELIEDSEFYQQLLKEIFESLDAASHEAAFYDIKRTQTKKRKLVDRRASKSRKIRYTVHDKLVNFMAPKPVNLPEMAPILFENLFGLRERKQIAEPNL